MTILLEEETTVSFDFDYRTLAEEVILAACDAERCPYEAEVNLIFILGIHKKSLVKQSDPAKGIAAQKHESPLKNWSFK